jgi:hypothetical protein
MEDSVLLIVMVNYYKNDELIVSVFNLTIIIPICIWLFRKRDMSRIYHVFAFYLIAGFINEIIHILFQVKSISILSTLIFHLIETQCILNVFLSWVYLNKNFQKLYHILFFILSSIEFLYIFNTAEHNIFWIYILLIIVLVVLGIKILTSENLRNTISQKLIIISIIVYFIYYSILNILMSFLFDEFTQPIFINLYNIINLINFLSYISYSLAFLWAPKKEKYL